MFNIKKSLQLLNTCGKTLEQFFNLRSLRLFKSDYSGINGYKSNLSFSQRLMSILDFFEGFKTTLTSTTDKKKSIQEVHIGEENLRSFVSSICLQYTDILLRLHVIPRNRYISLIYLNNTMYLTFDHKVTTPFTVVLLRNLNSFSCSNILSKVSEIY